MPRRPKPLRRVSSQQAAQEFSSLQASLVAQFSEPGRQRWRFNARNAMHIWEFKCVREGTWDELKSAAKEEYLAEKAAWKRGEVAKHPSWVKTLERFMLEDGYTKEDAIQWWRETVDNLSTTERMFWSKQILGEHVEKKRKRGDEEWRREDLPDDIAWVSSRPCLFDERQGQDPKPPLTDDDYYDCPSPQAKFMLAMAYADPKKFLQSMLDTFKQQWGKKQATPTVETKVAEVQRVEEQKAEAPPPPVPLTVSDAAKRVEELLAGAK